MGRMVLLGVLLAGCAHTAEGPLDVPIGLPRTDLAGELRRYDYCPPADPSGDAHEIFPHCDDPGADYRDSWVEVDYDGGRVTRVERFERWDDDARATQRWEQLVTERGKKTAATEDARALVKARHDLPAGTRSWQAFKTG